MAFWNKKNVDERVRNMQNQIYREIYMIVNVICLLSIVIKFITIEIAIQAILVEGIIVFASSIYYVVRTTYLGIFSDEVEMHDRTSKVKLSTKNIIIGIAMGLVFALIFGLNSAVNYADTTSEAIYYFFLVFFVSLFIYAPFFSGFFGLTYLAAKRKSDQVIQKDLDDNEGKW